MPEVQSAIGNPQSATRKPSANWLNVRAILRGVKLRQTPAALKTAGRMALVMPLVQIALLVGVLNAEWWIALLGVEGVLIGSLAASQLSQRDAENRFFGLAIAFLNTVALSAIGLFIGSHVFWITGVAAFVPFAWLILAPTRPRTVLLCRLAFSLLLMVAFALCGIARYCIESAPACEAESRLPRLHVAWGAFIARGGNGTERALLRLRMAQTAFELGEYQQAFTFADDGLTYPDRRWRDVPRSPIDDLLLRSLLQIKAQAFYNFSWNKKEPARSPLPDTPLDEETRQNKETRVRWGY